MRYVRLLWYETLNALWCVFCHESQPIVRWCKHPPEAHGVFGCEVRDAGGVCPCMKPHG